MKAFRRAREGTRWEQDNRLYVNPWPFVAIAVAFAVLVGVGFLFSAL